MTAAKIENELKSMGNKEIATHSQRFFKTGSGQYGEGDIFIGIRVPVIRQLVSHHHKTELSELIKLLRSPLHEVRLFALLALVKKYERASPPEQLQIYKIYISNTKYINNWDLVDSSAPQIVGGHLFNRNRDLLYKFTDSKILWQRRIAVLATFYFIRHGDFADTLAIAEALLDDKEDLIHKAVGWMLREIGKRNQSVAEKFLNQYHTRMPRTMLRYAIERYTPQKRKMYMKK